VAWIVAGIAVVAVAVVMLWRSGSFQPAAAPEMGNAGSLQPGTAVGSAGGVPDISNMTPEERFERLWDRVIRASEAGDTGTVNRFSPMALTAYSMLPAANPDLRFHAALIHLATADYDGALALADTILAEAPGHLFGYVIRGQAADRLNRVQALERSYRDFLAQYDAELRSGRPEYEGHKPVLDDFRTRALASGK
jgi:hypothetical protein